MFNRLKARWLIVRWQHLRTIGKTWWLLVFGTIAAFSYIDWAIEKWNLFGLKMWWEGATNHLPPHWEVWVFVAICAAVILIVDGSYRQSRELGGKIETLTWPSERPILLFDGWGEPPHDHPEAKFHPVTEWRKEPEYFERGIFLINDGEKTAHDVRLRPIELAPTVKALGIDVSRIAAKDRGFAFVSMDIEHNAKFTDKPSRWDLLGSMAIIEARKNAATLEYESLCISVGVCYRDANHVWYLSWAYMWYIKEDKRMKFGPTTQEKSGLKPPW